MGKLRSVAAPAPYCAKHPEESEQQCRKEGGQGTTAHQGTVAGFSGPLGDAEVSSP